MERATCGWCKATRKDDQRPQRPQALSPSSSEPVQTDPVSKSSVVFLYVPKYRLVTGDVPFLVEHQRRIVKNIDSYVTK
eukprot:6122480-Amphidinium_carterae.1